MKKFMLLLSLAFIMFSSGCSSKQGDKKDNIRISTSIYPLQFLTEEIGKEKVDVKNILPVGVDSHDFEPSIRDIGKIEEDDLFIFIGSGLEPWGEKAIEEKENKEYLVASESVKLISSNNYTDEKDDHGNKDPHIWLSPSNMRKIGVDVKDRLIELDKKNKNYYEKNFKKVDKKLSNLNKKYKEELSKKTSSTILVSHSAFRYLEKDYDLKQLYVSGVNSHSEPSTKTILRLIKEAKKEKLEYMYFETLTNPKAVEVISKEAGLKTSTLNPIEGLTKKNVKDKKDYITIMEENLENIKKELLK